MGCFRGLLCTAPRGFVQCLPTLVREPKRKIDGVFQRVTLGVQRLAMDLGIKGKVKILSQAD